jgi:hypothetical protein
MTTVFLGGSRRVTRVPSEAIPLLEAIVAEESQVIVGDANGADRMIQSFLADRRYQHVTVYCTEGICRNNVGDWPVRQVESSAHGRDFAFYAAKDRRMAEDASRGLMLWDAESVGTLMNLERLVALGKATDLIVVPRQQRILVRSRRDLDALLALLPEGIRNDFQGKRESEQNELAATERKPVRMLPF